MTEKEEEKEDNHKERKERDNREEPSKERKQFPRFVGTLPSAEYLQSSQLVPATWEKMMGLKMNTPPIPQSKDSPRSPLSQQPGVVPPPSGCITNMQ